MDTYKIVRFSEGSNGDGKAHWYFFSEQCRHCLTPGCMGEVEKGEIVQDEKTGAVLFTPKTKGLNFKAALEGCPYNIPRQNPKTKVMAKCTMCFDRITNNMIPACVKSCPTGAMTFGERDKILDAAKKRVEELKKTFPKAEAINADDVRVIYLVTDDPKLYLEVCRGQVAAISVTMLAGGRDFLQEVPSPDPLSPKTPIPWWLPLVAAGPVSRKHGPSSQ